MPLTEQEKVRIRFHTGYLNVQAASTFVLGVPAAVETQFIIEGAMNRVLEEALPLLRDVIRVLDEIMFGHKVDGLELLQVDRVDEITIRQGHQIQLDQEYRKWIGKLCDLLGVMPNPYSKHFAALGGINVPVS